MIRHVFINDFGPFPYFEWKQLGAINVIVGENDTGKSILMKMLYSVVRSVEESFKTPNSIQEPWKELISGELFWVFQPGGGKLGELVTKGRNRTTVEVNLERGGYAFSFGRGTTRNILDAMVRSHAAPLNTLYLPPKEILTAFHAIAATRESLEIFGFDDTYLDLIQALRVPSTKGDIDERLMDVLDSAASLCGGHIRRERDDFIFQRGREKYSMSQTADGIKKVGILSSLIKNRSIRDGTVLFVDEPESNLHPHGIVALSDMLFALSQAGIQVILATHSYFVIKELHILARKSRQSIPFCSLKRSSRGVEASFSDLRDGMPENEIVDAAVALYEEDVLADMEP